MGYKSKTLRFFSGLVLISVFLALGPTIAGTSAVNANEAPLIQRATCSPQATVVGSGVDLHVEATDGDADPMVAVWYAPAGTFSSLVGTSIRWTAPNAPGDYSIGVHVRDSKGNFSEADVTVSVIDHVIALAGTAIEAKAVGTFSSATAKVGQRITLEVTKDVQVNGFTVIPQGSPGIAEITGIERAGSFGTAGSVTIKAIAVTSLDGNVLPVSGSMLKRGDRGPAMLYGGLSGGILWYLAGGPAGVVAAVIGSGLTTGSEAVVGSGTSIHLSLTKDEVVFLAKPGAD